MKETDIKNNLVKLIKGYNPYCEHITLSTIYSKLSKMFHVVNYGPNGTGKSYSSLELIKQLDCDDQIILDNTTTPKGLFETFLNYPQQDILLDECSAIIRDKASQDMIKLAMERKPLTWTKDKSTVTTEPYQGNIIINTNEQVGLAIIDRSYLNKSIMNKEMAISFVNYSMGKPSSKELVECIKKRIKKEKGTVLDKDEIEYVRQFIIINLKDTEEELGYSRRVVNRIMEYFRCTKLLFGDIAGITEFIEPLAKLYIVNHKTPSLIDAIVSNGTIDKIELIKKVAHEGGYSEGHSRRLVNKAIEVGELKLKGRLVTT